MSDGVSDPAGNPRPAPPRGPQVRPDGARRSGGPPHPGRPHSGRGKPQGPGPSPRGNSHGHGHSQGHGHGHGHGQNHNHRHGNGNRRHASGHAPGKASSRPPLRLLPAADPASLAPASGILLLADDGWGELRRAQFDYSSRPDDVLVPPDVVRRHSILQGSLITGKAAAAPGLDGQPMAILQEVEAVDGLEPSARELTDRIPFKELTCIDPLKKFRLSGGTRDPSLRLLDLLTPLGKGQRGLIVAPPRTGKTVLLQRLARSISENHPEVHLIALLVDERPEEATDWKRNIRGEVLSSTSDEMAATHVAIAELVIERAKRLVELGRDVVILFDSLTRLGRAYNLETRNSGRTLSGGVDARTLERPKGFFGAARNTEEAGSLTIIATALIETGSRMDEVIFEEFKGTGNMELVLSRKLADLRIFPAIDVHLSGTRKEEKLIPPEQLKSIWGLRRILQNVDAVDGMRLLIKKVETSGTNEEMLATFRE